MENVYKDVFNLDELFIETIIGALNKYFANDKYDTSFIEVRRNGVVYRVSTDDLIAWLRTKHGIFYYPGMEAKYAKTERIPPFTERIMDKGALNSLKKLYKNVTGEEDQTSSHTLIASTISCNFSNKDRMISLLKEQNELLKDEIRNCNAELATKWTKTSLIDWLHQRARHKNVELDDAFLYSDDTQYNWTDIVDFLFDEIVKMREELISLETDLKKAKTEKEKFLAELKEVNEKRWKDLSDINKALGCGGMNGHVDDFATAVKARAECVFEEHKGYPKRRDKAIADYQALCEEYQDVKNNQRSDINKLIRDYCTKNDIIAPSPYLSDEACVEYLFLVVDLEREHRAAVGKQMVEDYKKDIMDHIRQEASLNGFNLPEKVDGEPLTIKRVFHDLLDLMRIRGEELRILKSKCNHLNEIVGELNALNDEIKE